MILQKFLGRWRSLGKWSKNHSAFPDRFVAWKWVGSVVPSQPSSWNFMTDSCEVNKSLGRRRNSWQQSCLGTHQEVGLVDDFRCTCRRESMDNTLQRHFHGLLEDQFYVDIVTQGSKVELFGRLFLHGFILSTEKHPSYSQGLDSRGLALTIPHLT